MAQCGPQSNPDPTMYAALDNSSDSSTLSKFKCNENNGYYPDDSPEDENPDERVPCQDDGLDGTYCTLQTCNFTEANNTSFVDKKYIVDSSLYEQGTPTKLVNKQDIKTKIKCGEKTITENGYSATGIDCSDNQWAFNDLIPDCEVDPGDPVCKLDIDGTDGSPNATNNYKVSSPYSKKIPPSSPNDYSCSSGYVLSSAPNCAANGGYWDIKCVKDSDSGSNSVVYIILFVLALIVLALVVFVWLPGRKTRTATNHGDGSAVTQDQVQPIVKDNLN